MGVEHWEAVMKVQEGDNQEDREITWKTKMTSAASARQSEMTARRQMPQLRKSLMPASWMPLRMA